MPRCLALFSYSVVIHTDEELLRRIVIGDQRAFEELFRSHYKRLCQFAFLFLHSTELSEEAVSDVFFSLWMKREQLKSIRKISPYLYSAVRNQAIDYIRTKNVQPQENTNVYELELESSMQAADETIEREQLRSLIQQAIDMLPEKCKMIARMHFNDQLLYREIAEILNISRKTVETQIAIATAKIKETFEKFGWNK